MKIGTWARLLLTAAPLLAGCSGFWSAPSSSTTYTLTNSGNLSVAPGATSGNTATITVTPSSTFTGTIALACAVSTSPTGATSPATCGVSPASVTVNSTAPQTSTLTATTTANTTAGTYDITVTGTSGSVSQTTTLCAQVSTTSATCTVSSGSGGSVFYVLDQGTMQIAAYSLANGAPTAIGSAYTLSAAPYSIAISPKGGFLYVGTAAGIFLFDIGTNGSLTLANSNNVISQDVATTMQVDSTNSWLLEAGPNLAELLAIHISSTTGAPTSNIEQNTLLPAATVQQLTISPDNAHVFVALGASGTEDVTFAAGNGTPFGAIANIAVLHSGGAAVSVAVDPVSATNQTSRLLYIGETAALSGASSGGLRALNYNTLAEITNSPFATGGTAPYAIAPMGAGANAGKYVYVANRTVSGSSTGNISGFAVSTSGSTTSLSPLGSPAAAGINPLGLTQDSTGTYLLVVDFGGSPDVQGYTFDATTAGKLDSAFTLTTGSGTIQATAIAAAP